MHSIHTPKLADKHVFKRQQTVDAKGHFTLDSLPFQMFTSVSVISLQGIFINEAVMKGLISVRIPNENTNT